MFTMGTPSQWFTTDRARQLATRTVVFMASARHQKALGNPGQSRYFVKLARFYWQGARRSESAALHGTEAPALGVILNNAERIV